MALYVPLSRRRRNATIVAVAMLIAGLIAGFVVGRSTSVTPSERASEVRSEGDTLGTRLEALTIEYEQAVKGTGDTIQGGVLDALDIFDTDLDQLIDQAPWLGQTQIDTIHHASVEVRQAAEDAVSTDDFASIADTSAKVVRSTFGA
ncbi:MAG: hypothetical protein ABIR32_07960 [Ilumatobacteraceae bacterium]